MKILNTKKGTPLGICVNLNLSGSVKMNNVGYLQFQSLQVVPVLLLFMIFTFKSYQAIVQYCIITYWLTKQSPATCTSFCSYVLSGYSVEDMTGKKMRYMYCMRS
jgi:FlaA1/EpsC-like NDP-sugar epimerase